MSRKMKGMLGKLAASVLLADVIAHPLPGIINNTNTTTEQQKEDDRIERRHKMEEAAIRQYKAQGLKQFFYGENSLWALNKKSADRKAKRYNWI